MTSDVDQLLGKLRNGDESAIDKLTTMLYGELHRIASRHLKRERAAHTLQTTALVNEAYLKLVGDRERVFASRVHFLAVASRVMRQVLVDYARARTTRKRSGESLQRPGPYEWTAAVEVDADSGPDRIELLELDVALDALAHENQSLAQLIEMRYFGGMTAEESAAALGLSVHVVRHDLRLAQAWLRRKMSD